MNMLIPKTEYIRDKKHLEFIRQLPCAVCGTNYLIDAAHVRFIAPCGVGLKPGDNNTAPLCRPHHTEQHQWPTGEEAWWEIRNKDPEAITETLWAIYKRDWPVPQKLDVAERYLRDGYI